MSNAPREREDDKLAGPIFRCMILHVISMAQLMSSLEYDSVWLVCPTLMRGERNEARSKESNEDLSLPYTVNSLRSG